MKTCYLLSTLFSLLYALPQRILVSGDIDDGRSDYYFRVAKFLANSPSNNYTVYKLAPHLGEGQIEQAGPRLFYYGLPTVGRDLDYDEKLTEFENFDFLEERMISLFFQEEKFLDDLKAMKFDVGVGSLSFSDTLLFRELGIQYVKITKEDIESFDMQMRLNMPVMTSTYPSKQMIQNHWGVKKKPKYPSFDSRWEFFQLYQWNKYEKYQRTNKLKELLDSQYHHHIDDWDQEHTIFLAEGLPLEIYQSPISRPPNVKTVFPMIGYTPERTEVIPDEWYTSDFLAVFVLNFEDKTDPTYDDPDMTRHLVKQILKNKKMRDKQIEKKIEKLREKGKENTDKTNFYFTYQIVYWPADTTKNQDLLEDLLNAQTKDQEYRLHIIYGSPLDTSFPAPDPSKQEMHVLAPMKMEYYNYFMRNYDNVTMGFYYHPESATQMYNCYKMDSLKFGKCSDNKKVDVAIKSSAQRLQGKKELKAKPLIKNLQEYLRDTEANDTENLEFWIDYVYEFGASHKVPAYDKMSFFQYHNIDLVGVVLLAFFIWIKSTQLFFRFLWSMCCKQVVVQGPDGQREKKKKQKKGKVE